MRTTTSRRRRAAWGLAAVGVAAAGLYGLGPIGATASSHREAPLIAADPAVDNTDVYAFVSPDKPGHRHAVGELDPVRGAQRRPELLPVRHRRPVRHLHRQRRRRRADVTMRFTFKNIDKRGRNTFLYNNGPVTSLTTRTCCSARPSRWRRRSTAQRWTPRDQGRSRGAVPGRPGVDAELPDAARPGDHQLPTAGSSSPARPTTRSSSTCGSSTCSTAATSVRSARTRSRATTSTPSRCRCR